MTAALVVVALVVAAIALALGARVQASRREAYVRTYMFPAGLIDRLGKHRPGLALKDRQLAARALRQFFLAYLKGGRRAVAMPSQITDDLWHEFILHTQAYRIFCNRAFGRFLHHAPAAVLGTDRTRNEGLRRVWWRSCLEENINPRRPTRLPLLFAIDGKLSIADGFRYALDCRRLTRDGATTQCTSDFSDSSVDGSTAGFGDSASDGFGGGGGTSGGGGSSADSGASSDGGSSDGGSGGCSGGCGGGGE